MPGITETKGRCVACKRIWQWTGKPRLCEAVCPRCSIRLERCQAMTVGERLFQKPGRAA